MCIRDRLYRFENDPFVSFFGVSVSGAGDVNGDGVPDLVVGSPADSSNGANSGRAWVYSGANGAVLYTFDGDPGDILGFEVSGAGDVNDDGFDDLIVGAEFDGSNLTASGSVRVFSGFDGSVLYNFEGDAGGDRFGHSVSGVGDVNGDGIPDFFAGSVQGGANGGGYARLFVSQFTVLKGDVNQDGRIDFGDIPAFIAVIQAGVFQAEADCDCNGMVDFADIPAFIAILLMQ